MKNFCLGMEFFSCHYVITFLYFTSITLVDQTFAGAFVLNGENYEEIIGKYEFIFINFYADWCKYSVMLAPIWDEAADKIIEHYPNGNVLFAKLDCEKETEMSSKFGITKYPTIKYVQDGQIINKEYRGKRTVDGFFEFINQQLEDVVVEFTELDVLKNMNDTKAMIVAFVDDQNSSEARILKRISRYLKHDCLFFLGYGDAIKAAKPKEESVFIYYSSFVSLDQHTDTFRDQPLNLDNVLKWAKQKCVNLVREITFENAEELTEEGLPLFILFYHPNDVEIKRKFSQVINKYLASEREKVNFVTANGILFAHPLFHLQKSEADLPLIAIDSFRHMYLFPNIKDMETPGVLKQFLSDLQSGKLHREFHYGPDQTSETQSPPTTVLLSDGKRILKTDSYENSRDFSGKLGSKPPTTAPKSIFQKLKPSKNRYTLLRDEL